MARALLAGLEEQLDAVQSQSQAAVTEQVTIMHKRLEEEDRVVRDLRSQVSSARW
jgi:hypothetical protein